MIRRAATLMTIAMGAAVCQDRLFDYLYYWLYLWGGKH